MRRPLHLRPRRPKAGHVVLPAVAAVVLGAIAFPMMASARPVGSNPLPGPPIGLTAVGQNQQVSLSWAPPSYTGTSSIQGYNVFVGTTSGGETGPVNGSLIAGTTYTVGSLTNGTVYYFKVAAVNGSGQGAMSVQKQATPSNANVSITKSVDNAAPDDCTDVTYTLTANNAGPSPALNTSVYDALPAGLTYVSSTNHGGTLDFNGNSVTWYLSKTTTMAPSTSMYYKATITAEVDSHASSIVNTANESQTNGNATGTQTASATIDPVAVAAPPPTGLTAVNDGGVIDLDWSPPACDGGSNILGYNIYESTTSGTEFPGTPVNSTLIPGTSQSIAGLTLGTTYYFEVTAVNSTGEGSVSNESFATPELTPNTPSVPFHIHCSPGNGEVTVLWGTPVNDGGSAVTGYNVYVGTTAHGVNETLAVSSLPSSATSFEVTGLTNGTMYYFGVTALNGNGQGIAAQTNSTPYTTPSPPTITMATAGTKSVTIMWTAPTSDGGYPGGVTGYWVYDSTTSGGEGPNPVWPHALSASATSFTLSGLTPGVTYYFEITARNPAGQSGYSNEMFATPS